MSSVTFISDGRGPDAKYVYIPSAVIHQIKDAGALATYVVLREAAVRGEDLSDDGLVERLGFDQRVLVDRALRVLNDLGLVISTTRFLDPDTGSVSATRDDAHIVTLGTDHIVVDAIRKETSK